MKGALRLPAMLAVVVLVGATLHAALGPLYGGVVRLEVAHLPDSPAPLPHQSVSARWTQALVHETLVVLDPEGRLQPRLMTGWVTAAEDREWTCTLPEGLLFHDGRTLTSADAARSLRRFLRSNSPAAERLAAVLDGGRAFRAQRLDALPGLDAPEPDRLVLRTVARDPRLLLWLAARAAAVTSPQGAGAGPFAPSLWTAKGATLTAFSGHVSGRPLLDEVQVTLAGAGGADLRAAGPSGWTPVTSGAATLLLILDPGRAPFDSPAARRTVSSAIDAERLVQHFLRRGEALRSLLPRDLALGAVRARPARRPGRVEGALTLAVSTDVPPLVSQRVVAHLGALGLAVKVAPGAPDATLTSQAAARLVLWSPEIADSGAALQELAGLGARAGDETRRILEAAHMLTGEAWSAELARAEDALLATHTLIPLAAVPVEIHARPGVHGLRIDAGGVLHLEDAWRQP
jgi:MarR-like DNA-binding transcriptional regulator SgrR of sgrS sRNA